MNRRSMLAALTAAAAARLKASEDDATRARATRAVIDAIPLAESDPERPVYHFRPPASWTNDPNGTIYYKGWHHLFYQLNPFAARLGNQHWGHARSRDLVNWEHLPIAICPSQDKGEKAIYSGGAVLAADGRPRLIYTSIGKPDPEQWMAVPLDDELLTWEKFAGNPVVTQAHHVAGPIAQWRDPFMFKKDGSTYMVCGGASNSGKAQVQLYRATKSDLTEWKHLGAIFQSIERDVRNFECPNLFPLDGRWVLIVSPNRVCEYWVGDLDIARMQFVATGHGVVDSGDSYASNISVDESGRTLLWFWGRTDTPQGKGWAGVITMPRALSIGPDGYLRQQPVPEFQTLRGEPKKFGEHALDRPFVLEEIAADCAEIEAEFSGFGNYGVELRRSNDGKPGIAIAMQGAYLTAGTARAFVGNGERHRMRIFLDKRTVEVFADDGAAAMFKSFDAAPHDLGIALFGRPAAFRGFGDGAVQNRPAPRLESLTIWPMHRAKFDLTAFR